MIATLGARLTRLSQRFIPDPFVIAVLLFVVTCGIAFAFGDFGMAASRSPSRKLARILDCMRGSDGLWKFLAFSMQMCLVLVSGYALAAAPIIRRGLDALASLPRSTASGAALVALIASACAIFNWGLGLVAGAILAREVGVALTRRSIPCHFPLIVASGYTGLMVWHGGLSGSAPLTMTTMDGAKKVLPERILTMLSDSGYSSGVALNETIFSPLNLVVTLGLLIVIPVTMRLMAPRAVLDHVHPPKELMERHVRPGLPDFARMPLAERLEHTRAINLLLGLVLLATIVRFGIADDLRRLGINEINALMTGLALVLHPSARSFVDATDDAARGCAGIIIQFPLYAGITGIMESSGLLRQLAQWFLDISSPGTLPTLSMIAGSIINFFVPSGGGQWGVQGPIVLDAALSQGVKPGPIILSVAYGDQLTNMLQPFWALPLLSICKTEARDILGYLALVMLAGGAWMLGVMLVMT
jgi:short-chain fatty acids transporter